MPTTWEVLRTKVLNRESVASLRRRKLFDKLVEEAERKEEAPNLIINKARSLVEKLKEISQFTEKIVSFTDQNRLSMP